ncbi:MAG TPA: type VI secretion system-associated FHA domain protein TagH [Steroidobacteraceae bacterium]|nr:type VI secretion system-associated FHA domain protein TagH [Steroidobacteraceae bacterium]
MALRVSVVSEHSAGMGEEASKVFGVHGGSIGRGRDNEWILPDPERFLSGKHARIEFRAGRYYLVDTSSNGTYVNGAQVPLGRFHEYALQDGDYVRIGEYELQVSIDASNDFPPEHSAIVAYDGASVPGAVRKATADDLGADLDLAELLEPSNRFEPSDRFEPSAASVARDAYGQPIRPDEPVPWHMMTRPLARERAAAPGPRTPAHALTDTDCDPGLTAFCRGAGIDPRALSPEARGAALQLAGQLLRETVLGLMDLGRSHEEFRERLRIAPPHTEGGDSVIRFDQGVDETLLALLTTLSKRAGSVESVRERFRELKAESGATLAALHAALEEFLARFDPRELEERFERGGKRGVFATQNKARYWDLYADLYAGLSQRATDGLPLWFAEAFAKAYVDRLGSLLPRRGALGEAAAAD